MTSFYKKIFVKYAGRLLFMRGKHLLVLLMAMMMIFMAASCSQSADSSKSGNLMLYSSLKEDQLQAFKEAFNAIYPNIRFDYYSAGAGSIMTKIATEHQAGRVGADLLWVGEPTNYMILKNQGMLEPYVSPEAAVISDIYKDPDNTYVGARLVVMGIAYNTTLVTDADIPTKWGDLLKETFKGQIVITDPVESGTMGYTLGALVNSPKYGWDYFERLKTVQGAELASGATGTHNNVAAGGYKVCIAVDYITQTLEDQGATIKFVYPEEDIVTIFGPIAIFKGSPNMDNAKLFYDFILTAAGQQVLVDTGATPIRPGISRAGTMSIEEINSKTIAVDDVKLAAESNDYFNRFDAIYKK